MRGLIQRLTVCGLLALALLLVGTGRLPAAVAAYHPEPAPGQDGALPYSTGEKTASPEEKGFRLSTPPGVLAPQDRVELRISESLGELPAGRDFRAVSIVHEEDKITLFSAVAEVGSKADPLSFVFPEGAPYRVNVANLVGFPRTDGFDLDVAPLAPDRQAQVRAGLLLLFVYLLGIAGGAALARARRSVP